MNFRAARASDLPAIRELLTGHGLPTEDLTEGKLADFLVGEDPPDPLQGCVGVEVFNGQGLLRSLAMAPSARSRGFGTQALQAIESLASSRQIRQLYLLTNTAPGFFERFGYQQTSRDHVPAPIAATAEFSALCPASAICMTKCL